MVLQHHLDIIDPLSEINDLNITRIINSLIEDINKIKDLQKPSLQLINEMFNDTNILNSCG